MEGIELSSEQRLRYARNINVDEIGVEGQRRLLQSRVTVVGCGALGSVAAMYLAAAGVGYLHILDYDTIDVSNLQRQVFFTAPECGCKKVNSLASKIRSLNPEVKLKVTENILSSTNAEEILRDSDYVIDATDNPESKRLVDSTCAALGLPRSIGGVDGFRGLVTSILGREATYCELFPSAASEGVMPCSARGVIGPAAGVVACIQSSEAIKYLIGCKDLLAGRLLAIDLLTPSFHIYTL